MIVSDVSVSEHRGGAFVRGLSRVFLDERDGPLPALLLALTVLAGLLDAISILRLGGVFVATITGNLIFLGLAAAGATGFHVVTSAISIVGFVVGVLVGDRACRAARSHRGRALRNVLAFKLWRRGLAVGAFLLGALLGAVIILSLGVIVALIFGLSIIAGVAIAAHLLSRTSAEWAAPPSP